MIVEQHQSKSTLSKSFLNPQEYHYLNTIMDVRTGTNPYHTVQRKIVEGRKLQYRPSFSQGGRVCRYFTSESLFLLLCLTASLLILPLVLPPLPPPPLLLLLVPICILALLMVLAFMPSNARDATYTYV